jgi:hypothetical protein
MMGLVMGVRAETSPVAARTRPEKTITVDTVRLDGSAHNPATQVDMANAILSQCNVRVRHGVNATATAGQTTGWLGGNNDLRSANNCKGPSAEERALFRGAPATFGFSARFRAFFAASVTGVNGSGYSCLLKDAPAPLFRNTVVVLNSGDAATLSHELGHILTNSGGHPGGTVMAGRPAAPAMRRPRFIDPQCTKLHANA